MEGYVIAAFDATINAISNGLWQCAQHPKQWEKLRKDPSKASAAFQEIVRIDSPLQHLSRVTTREVDLGEGVVLPAGARVIVSYASGNRDERHYRAPDSFDIERNLVDHLGFGLATHNCAGQALANLEGMATFAALARYIDGFTLTGRCNAFPTASLVACRICPCVRTRKLPCPPSPTSNLAARPSRSTSRRDGH
ncbi:cytochrome P450 [Xanthomonas axonopodis pv. vasculorum]|uniref:cytochrome P450 n=1 Tax=Xanthomonas axonopodis TaxID=53413 RepID=UPI000AAD83DB|nr:cytochrome P450 [Xanthomonas axonopodis]